MDVTQAQAVEILRDAHARMAGLFASLTDPDLVRRGAIAGEWSAKDLAGHIASWEEMALRTLEEWRRHERPWIEDVLGDGRVDEINGANVRRWLGVTPEEALRRFAVSERRITDAIAGIDDEEWASTSWWPRDEPRVLGRFLGGIMGAPDRPFGHAYAHLNELEVYAASRTKP